MYGSKNEQLTDITEIKSCFLKKEKNNIIKFYSENF